MKYTKEYTRHTILCYAVRPFYLILDTSQAEAVISNGFLASQ